jgi:hypothetical protein
MTLAASGLVCLCCTLFCSTPTALAGDFADVPRPKGVYGGEPTQTCGWPTTVSLGGCTATLVHPRVIIYAAHCGSGQDDIALGESANSPAAVVQTAWCRAFPGYQIGNGTDHAFCVLAQSVNLEIVPILMGCEAEEALQPGAEVEIVGFGQNDTGNPYGTKHQATTYLNSVQNDEAFIGGGGTDVCGGDSGGPAYIQLDDGTWRVFGITSYGDPACLAGSYFSMMHIGMEWFESELAQEGIDITPCHDSDGTWNPSEDCTGFPTDPKTPAGDWASGCDQGTPSGWSSTCGPPYGGGEPPVVTITSPADGTALELAEGESSVSVDVLVDATDEDSEIDEVSLLVDGADAGTLAGTDPLEWTIDLELGDHSLQAIAIDEFAQQGESAIVEVTVDPAEPPEETGGSGTGSGGGETDDPGTDDGGTGTGTETGAGSSDEGSDGCGCRTVRTDAAPSGLWGLLLAWCTVRRRAHGRG